MNLLGVLSLLLILSLITIPASSGSVSIDMTGGCTTIHKTSDGITSIDDLLNEQNLTQETGKIGFTISDGMVQAPVEVQQVEPGQQVLA